MIKMGGIVLAALAAAALAGCVTMGAQEKEGQLAAAGFTRQQADTPQKMAKLQALPQNMIVFSQRKHGAVYIYADAAGCGCAFIGNAAAYQQYQQIRAANNIAQMQETTAMLNARRGDGLGRRVGSLRSRLVLIGRAAAAQCDAAAALRPQARAPLAHTFTRANDFMGLAAPSRNFATAKLPWRRRPLHRPPDGPPPRFAEEDSSG